MQPSLARAKRFYSKMRNTLTPLTQVEALAVIAGIKPTASLNLSERKLPLVKRALSSVGMRFTVLPDRPRAIYGGLGIEMMESGSASIVLHGSASRPRVKKKIRADNARWRSLKKLYLRQQKGGYAPDIIAEYQRAVQPSSLARRQGAFFGIPGNEVSAYIAGKPERPSILPFRVHDHAGGVHPSTARLEQKYLDFFGQHFPELLEQVKRQRGVR